MAQEILKLNGIKEKQSIAEQATSEQMRQLSEAEEKHRVA